MQSGLNSNPKKIKQNEIYDLKKLLYKKCIYDFSFINSHIYAFARYCIISFVFICK